MKKSPGDKSQKDVLIKHGKVFLKCNLWIEEVLLRRYSYKNRYISLRTAFAKAVQKTTYKKETNRWKSLTF